MNVIKGKTTMEVSREEMEAIKIFCREIIEIYEESCYEMDFGDILSDIGSGRTSNEYFSFKII